MGLRGFLSHHAEFREIAACPEAGKPEYVLSHLFGLPTSIRGFDDLFKGGGLMLADNTTSLGGSPNRESAGRQLIGSRIVLAIGPFGSGKSLLSLQIAIEVARKGGVAWVMALEQSEEECLYALEAVGISTVDPSFDIVRGPGPVSMALTTAVPPKGCLLFLRPDKNSWREFVPAAIEQLSWMRSYALRMLVVDPVDALIFASGTNNLRSETRRLFAAAKVERVNIWLTSERSNDREDPDGFAENIADTVIRLGVESEPDYRRRFIQVTKSRLQEEQPGRHAFMIAANGIRIDMSSSSPGRLSSASLRNLQRNAPLLFGVQGMAELMGVSELQPGDIVALAGPGKSKTLLGAEFLRANGQPANVKVSVFISDYSPERIRRFFDVLFPAGNAGAARPRSQVNYWAVSPGYIDTGRVLQDIEDVLERCRAAGTPDRVLITNLARWEQEMPLLSRDSTFGMALVSLMRRYGVVALIVCGDDSKRGDSRLRDIGLDSSDFLIEFTRVDSRGSEQTFMRSIKSRFMNHPRTAFQLTITSKSFTAIPAPMLNMDANGRIKPVHIRLVLHSETANHRRYNRRLARALRTSVSSFTRIAKQTEHYDLSILGMTRLSAVDELQIMQIDEFQLPHAASLLSPFPLHKAAGMLDDRLADLVRNVSLPSITVL